MIKSIKEYKNKKKLLIEHNKNYYDLDSPKIDDAKYDLLKKDLVNFEKKNQNKILGKKITDYIGYKVSDKFSKIKHAEGMLSLENAFDETDIFDFYKKNKSFVQG